MTVTRQKTNYNIMNLEAERYKTYEKLGWPDSAPVQAKDLAAAGLYYTGEGDRVACPFCKGCLNQWEAGDIPILEHRRVFPKCLFVQGMHPSQVSHANEENSTDSLPSTEPHYSIKSPPPDLLVPSKLGIPASGRLIHPLNIVTSSCPTPDVVRTCKFPSYVMENQRLETFRHWPARRTVKPMLLARAGFFYSGEGDEVTCFYCGGSLRSWENGDDPWVEHGKAFSKCEWLLQQKGPYFLQHVMTT